MKEKTLVIYLDDAVYGERLMEYCNNYKDLNLRAMFFSEKEGLAEFLNANSPDCILCDEAKRGEVEPAYSKAVKVLSEDDPKTAGLSKYMSAKALISMLGEGLFDREEPMVKTGRIIGFFSVFDDGRTETRAKEFAASCGESTLLLSFSPFFMGEEDEQVQQVKGLQPVRGLGAPHCEKLSELMFALTGEELPELGDYIEKQNGYDAIFGVSFVQDLGDFTAENAMKLCELLERSSYGRIAVDFGAFSGFMPVVAGACDRIIVEKTGTKAEENRLRELQRELEKAGFSKVYKTIAEAYEWNTEN